MKKLVSSLVLASLLGVMVYTNLEPSIVSAANTAATPVNVDVTDETAITGTASVTLVGPIASITGGSAVGDATWTVTSGGSKGYNLTLKKSQLLLTGAGGSDKQFSDYSTTTPTFNFETLANGAEEFGFSVKSGTDTVVAFKNNGNACGLGSNVDGKCFAAVPTGSVITVANSAAPTTAQGTATAVTFQAVAAGSNALQAGSYTTTVTATATSNP